MKALLGIDVGTSGVKAVTIDHRGRRIAEASSRYPTVTEGAAAEQDPEHWWNAVVTTVPKAAAGCEVDGVAVTSQAPTLVPVAAAGVPAGPALTWLDRRAIAEAQRIGDLVPDSRNGPDPFFGTAKLLWLAAHRPKILERASAVVSANGFVTTRLTGRTVLDESTASLMQGFDDAAGGFSDLLLATERSLNLLPEVVPATAEVGSVTEEAARQLGLNPRTMVFAGGIDSLGSALEAGALSPGDPMVDMVGFSSVAMTPVPRGTSVPGFIHSRHCMEDTDLLITAQVTAGAAIDWVNSLNPQNDLRQEAALGSRPRPGRVTMVPSLAGERTPSWNPDARGLISGIDLTTDDVDLMLAAMEGNAFALADDVAAMAEAGFPVERLLSTGGGASSSVWLQIKADVLGLPVMRPTGGHGAAQGAALLAGLGMGTFTSVDELRDLTGSVEARFTPDDSLHSSYGEARERYLELKRLNDRR